MATTREGLPEDLAPGRLGRRALRVVALLAVLVLIAVLTPGLDEVRRRLGEAQPGWLALAIVFEALSFVSYVLMFRPIFCRRMAWRSSLIKSSVNFVAVAVLGTVMAIGLVGPDLSLWLTAFPAALSLAAIALVAAVPRLGPGRDAPADASKLKRALAATRKALVGGTAEAGEIVRARDPLVVVGAIGYWAWDNAVLWATFHAVGATIPLTVVLMGYLIGQLGGLLPIPGGIGGIDGGLIGTLVVYGAPAGAVAASVLLYRVILFWLPLLLGAVCFASLRRALAKEERLDLCRPAPAH